MRGIRSVAVVPSMVLVSPVAALATEAEVAAPGSLDIELDPRSMPEAIALLRTILDARDVEPVGERALRVTDTPERLALAERLLAATGGEDAAATTLDAPEDATRIVAVPLGGAETATVSHGLRKVVGARRFGIVESSGVVVVRDSPVRTAAARALVDLLGRAGAP